LDRIEKQFCIDTNRIYATGKSQGGGFVGRLACDNDMSKRFAAFAPVSGAYYNSSITTSSDCNALKMPIECNPGRSDIPIMAFHGGADPRIPYFGGFSTEKKACLPDIRYWAKQWAKRDKDTSKKLHNTTIPDFTPKDIKADGATIMAFGDNGLVNLVFDGWDIPHDWPSTFENPDNDGKNLAVFNASTMIMDFFQSHQLTTA
jgi:poly(3-hydroxybutyrate) depolymerase